MKFPSLQQLWYSFKTVCLRFPLPIIFALLGTLSALILTYNVEDRSIEQIFIKIIYLSNFGLTLSFAVSLYAETKLRNKQQFILLNALVFIVLLLIYCFLDPVVYHADVLLLIVLGFAFHLLVAIAAFTSKEENNGFWQINKTFFLRFAISVLYSVVLFAGLSIALLSIQTLFDIKWDEKIYFRLWIIIAGLFNTVFFLSDIKKPLQALNNDDSYPKGLKVFTQYVLIPLATIYLTILLAYEVKIILQWTLPTSSVAILILGYAVFGILSLLLVHPIRNSEGNKWIHIYSKSFYLLMLPLLALLAVAIIKRVSDYGVTESRYLLIVLGIWLTFITTYFLLKGRDQIRIIPISLFIIAVLIVFDPWGIKSVSKHSQAKRLANYIKQKPGKDRNNEVHNLVRYLNENYGGQALQPFVKLDLKKIEKELLDDTGNTRKWELKYKIADTVLHALNIEKSGFYKDVTNPYYFFSNESDNEIDVAGAIKLVEINSNINSRERKSIPFELEGISYSIKLDSISNLVITGDSRKVLFDLNKLFAGLTTHKDFVKDNRDNGYLVPNQQMSISQKLGKYTLVCRINNINGYKVTSKNKFGSLYYSGYIIIYP